MRFSFLAGRVAVAAASAVVALAPAAAVAQAGPSLLVNTHPNGLAVYGGLHVGGGVWGTTTSGLGLAFGGRLTSAPTLLDLEEIMKHDALWVDQRYWSTPAAAELSNLAAYAATGRRVVIVGENSSWGPWNAAILGALGGVETPYTGDGLPGCGYGTAHAVGGHALTAGVASVNMACGGAAVGGTALFDYNVATLWGKQQNVLTVLDANLFDDRFMSVGGMRFRDNVVDWVAGPTSAAVATPEPMSVTLVGAGLLALGTLVRRRRR